MMHSIVMLVARGDRKGNDAVGLGFAIVLEREIAGLDTAAFDGRALAKKRHALDAIAHELDERGIGEFVAFSHAEAEALADDMKFDAPTTGKQSGRWFSAREGVRVVGAIRDYLRESPEELEGAETIVRELVSMAEILETAAKEDVRFRLSIDY